MVHIIRKNSTKKELETVFEKLRNRKPSKSLLKHFGKATEKIDGLEFQKKVRDEWN